MIPLVDDDCSAAQDLGFASLWSLFCHIEFRVCNFHRRQTKLREGNVFMGVCLSTGGGYVSSDDHHVSLAGGGCVWERGWVCPGGGYPRSHSITPHPVLTRSRGHQNTYGWQADGAHPTGMLSCCQINTLI